ncbi:MAG: antibiotic biosynthesis monooxygenase family protein [Alphaproteobacteria bacterium]
MIAVIFEVTMKPGRAGDYFDLAAALRPELERIDGFISVERFASTTTPGKYVSLSFWRDEEAVRRWREHGEHAAAQERGKAALFADFRIRVARVLRDYTLADRRAAK